CRTFDIMHLPETWNQVAALHYDEPRLERIARISAGPIRSIRSHPSHRCNPWPILGANSLQTKSTSRTQRQQEPGIRIDEDWPRSASQIRSKDSPGYLRKPHDVRFGLLRISAFSPLAPDISPRRRRHAGVAISRCHAARVRGRNRRSAPADGVHRNEYG